MYLKKFGCYKYDSILVCLLHFPNLIQNLYLHSGGRCQNTRRETIDPWDSIENSFWHSGHKIQVYFGLPWNLWIFTGNQAQPTTHAKSLIIAIIHTDVYYAR